MKKNLISILILALLVVNVVLTTIMMFSVTSTAKKTGALVTNIASVLNLELETKEEEKESVVSLADTVSYNVEKLTIALKHSTVTNADGSVTTDSNTHYCLIEVTLLIDSKHEEYATYTANPDTYASMFPDLINTVVGSHTVEELQNNQETVKDEILKKMHDAGFNFVYRISFRSIMYQ